MTSLTPGECAPAYDRLVMPATLLSLLLALTGHLFLASARTWPSPADQAFATFLGWFLLTMGAGLGGLAMHRRKPL